MTPGHGAFCVFPLCARITRVLQACGAGTAQPPLLQTLPLKPSRRGVCLCLLKPELPFFLCRSHGWLLQQAADGVWHRDSHRPPELRDRTGAGEEIQLKPSSNVEPLQHFAISNQESGLCLKENVGFFVGFLLVFFFF